MARTTICKTVILLTGITLCSCAFILPVMAEGTRSGKGRDYEERTSNISFSVPEEAKPETSVRNKASSGSENYETRDRNEADKHQDQVEKYEKITRNQNNKQKKENHPDSVVEELNNIMTAEQQNNDKPITKEEFIGDYSDRSLYYIDPVYNGNAKPLEVYDNTTGKIYKLGGRIEMHPGETRVLTVRLPYLAGYPTKLIRTTADGDAVYHNRKVANTRCDIDPDPDRIDFVNYKFNNGKGHWPGGRRDSPLLHTNYYDWIITAVGIGECIISQTCEYKAVKADGSPNGTPKAMIYLQVTVTRDNSDNQ